MDRTGTPPASSQQSIHSPRTTQSQDDYQDLGDQSDDCESDFIPPKRTIKGRKNISGQINTPKKHQNEENVHKRKRNVTNVTTGAAQSKRNKNGRAMGVFAVGTIAPGETSMNDEQKASAPTRKSGRKRTRSQRSKVSVERSQPSKHQHVGTNATGVASSHVNSSGLEARPQDAIAPLILEESRQNDQPYPSPTDALANSSTHDNLKSLGGLRLRSDDSTEIAPGKAANMSKTHDLSSHVDISRKGEQISSL